MLVTVRLLTESRAGCQAALSQRLIQQKKSACQAIYIIVLESYFQCGIMSILSFHLFQNLWALFFILLKIVEYATADEDSDGYIMD